MTTPQAPWEALPAEVWAMLLAALTGADALHLSHAHAWTWRLLAAMDETFWRERVLGKAVVPRPSTSPPDGSHSWKEAFARHRVLQFPGLRVDCMENDAAEDEREFIEAVDAEMRLKTDRWWVCSPAQLSIDAWICLLPKRRDKAEKEDAGRFLGGVVFGQQCSPCASPFWPHVRAHFMVVDANCNLHCSVLEEQHYKIRRLTVGRWYHVALTFSRDERAEVGHQSVFIDGELSSSLPGRLHPDWQRLKHAQIGTGYVAAGLHACPSGDFRGWYAFNGLIDEFRIWNGVLTEADARQLAAIKSPESLWHSSKLWFSMQRDGCPILDAAKAMLSRPSEGVWVR
jgi:hypothetical protein